VWILIAWDYEGCWPHAVSEDPELLKRLAEETQHPTGGKVRQKMRARWKQEEGGSWSCGGTYPPWYEVGEIEVLS
jgi:hypothetical protein